MLPRPHVLDLGATFIINTHKTTTQVIEQKKKETKEKEKWNDGLVSLHGSTTKVANCLGKLSYCRTICECLRAENGNAVDDIRWNPHVERLIDQTSFGKCLGTI